MSFGGFGGFGSNNQQNQQNQQQQNTGFGGFGSSTTNTGGFGSNTGGSAFGSNAGNTGNAAGTMFGGGTSGGFGSGGFGSNTASTSPFGAKPAFGAPNTTAGSLFGGNTSNSGSTGFGGFGSNTSQSTSAFGSPATTAGAGTTTAGSGGLFGANQNKPAFGAPATTGGSLFGGGSTSGGFGSSTGGFGASTGGFGQQQQQQQPQNQGTAVTPFAAHQEKDTASNSNSHYQSITFQQPYQNFSFEELRLADYNAGRRYGNSNGQAGAFGTSTGFGGFGQTTPGATQGGFGSTPSTSSGLFGGQSQTSSPFGQNNQQQQSNTSGGLFGSQNKPAGNGLFGNNANTSGTQSSGMFGQSNPSTSSPFGGFGASTSNNSGGGLFGNQNNQAQNQNQPQTQNKPFGGFGSSTTGTTSAFGGFGQQNSTANTSSGNMFGGGAAQNNSFGSTQQNQQPASGGLFGGGGGFGQNQAQNQNQPQTQPQNPTGGNVFGGFGQNQNQDQQKPMFGSSTTNTGGGLFGNNQNQQNQNGGGLFGNNQSNQQSGGLFGNKPATGGTMFGSTQPSTTSSGGLFGQTQSQPQNQGSSLFGQNNNDQQQQNKGLFGGSTTSNSGGLFGGLGQSTNQNQGGNSLFGGNQNAGGSLFGGSQQGQQQQQQPLMTSLMQNPYGNDQLFANLGTPPPAVGPLATPLSGGQKPAKRPQMLPAFKINPSQSMRLITPQKRTNGYGFSYSTYGTPGSAQSFTPGRSSLLGSGSVGRSLSKSLSTSNLRSSLSAEDSVLAPGAFTPNPRPYSSGGSIRRLKIDRSLRTDLFGSDGTAERPSKRVSFDGVGANGGSGNEKQTNGDHPEGTSNALVRTESDGPEPSSEELGLLRSSRSAQKDTRSNGQSSRPEMEEVRGNELAVVPEDEQAPATEPRVGARKASRAQADQEPGDFYMIPSMQELRDMSREQLKKISPYTVGRVGIGKIVFDEVDLTAVPLDEIMGDIVKLNIRSATVYETAVTTPPEGKGLNVPSTITLENSWPRSSGGRLPVHERKGPRYDKHIERLRRVGGTEFLSYNPDTGEWLFRVQHFTTYELDDDDDETMDDAGVSYEAADESQTTPTQGVSADASMVSPVNSDPDDTFDFKKGHKTTIPGGFGDQSVLDDEDMDDEVAHEDEGSDFGPAGPDLDDPFTEDGQAPMSPPDTDSEAEHDIAGTFPQADTNAPKSILKSIAQRRTPVKSTFELNDDWAEQLQRTLSPKKQDRRALREQQKSIFESDKEATAPFLKASSNIPAFNTTMDIMNSLWAQPKNASVRGRGVAPGGKGFEWPYDKRSQPDLDPSNMSETDRAFHDSVKPSWTSDGTLVYAIAGNAPALTSDDVMVNVNRSLVAEGRDVRFARFVAADDSDAAPLHIQLQSPSTEVSSNKQGVPSASISNKISFADMAESAAGEQYQAARHERQVWQLASILFDPLEVSCGKYIKGVPASQVAGLEHRIRRDAVLAFWTELTRNNIATHVKDANNAEEKALAYLSGGNIERACEALVEGRDFRLATMVSQLSGDSKTKEIMQKQIQAWRSQNVLSEISAPVRSLYELLAGNMCVSEGKTGASEDRAPTFGIADHFNLDWQRAFGLRLWYGSEDVVDAVQQYARDVADGKEKVKPLPFSAGEGPERKWKDLAFAEREDTLFALLRLYAVVRSGNVDSLPVRALFDPAAVSGSPVNARLAWQLLTILRARGIVKETVLPASVLDSLTVSLAAQLEALNNDTSLVTSVSVLLHLSTPTARERYLRDLLNRRAPSLQHTGSPSASTTNTTFNNLVQTLHIPAPWLHHALALHAASTHNPHARISHLLKAGDKFTAHAVLCKNVGPSAIISQDHASLRTLLDEFQSTDNASSTGVENWRTGGQVYADFLRLSELLGAGGRADEGEGREEKVKLLKRLAQTLPGAREGIRSTGSAPSGSGSGSGSTAGSSSGLDIEERVAVSEMARVVREEILRLGREEKIVDEKRIARLPVPDDAFVRQSVKLAGLYYRAVDVR